MTFPFDVKLIDLQVFGYDLLVLFSPGQGLLPYSAEEAQGGKVYWLGPLHWALCKG